MRIKKIKTVLILLVIILGVIPINTIYTLNNSFSPSNTINHIEEEGEDDYVPTDLKSSYQNVDPFEINDLDPNKDWAYIASQYDWCTGKGTPNDPYVIEGISIDAGYQGGCLTIRNSEKYFIINGSAIKRGAHNYYGICLVSSKNGIVLGNTFYDNYKGILIADCYDMTVLGNTFDKDDFGILVNYGYRITIFNNIVKDSNYYGIYLAGGNNMELSENTLTNCGVNIWSFSIADTRTLSIDTSNTVNGKPVYYYVDRVGLGGSDFINAGQIILSNCFDSTISNLVITKVSNGIALFDCGTIIISNNDISNNREKGILSMSSDNNIITGNRLNRNQRSGIQLWNSKNNIFSNNEVNNNGFMGIENIHGSSSNEISENHLTYNKQGISLYGDCRNNDIRANFLESNGQGITISSNAGSNVIIENHIIRSTGVGCLISSGTANNLVHSNYFSENSQNANDGSTFGANQWDNGLMGNFWDDYDGIDLDENGIGDSPYNISGAAGSQDRFPLMEMLPDFEVVLEDFIFTIGVGEIEIHAGIKNVGFSYIGGLVVSILEVRLDGSIVQIASFQFQNLVRDAKAYLSVLWIPTKYHKIKVIIDPLDEIREYHESNNIAEKTYTGNPPTIVQVYSEFGSWTGDIVGMFLAGVSFDNVFTAVVEDLDGGDDIEQVIFELNGNPVNAIDGPGNLWYREINLADLHAGSNVLKIKAYDKGGNFDERIITINAMELPFWLEEVIINVGYQWVKVGFNFATLSLFIEFEYPYEGADETNFNKPIPPKVPFVGGTGNVYNLTVTFRFEFSFLTMKAYLTLTGKFTAKVYGVEVIGTISGKTKINPITLDIESATLTITLTVNYTPFQHRTKAKSVTINCGVTGSVYFSIEIVYYSIGKGIDYASFEIVTKLSICGWLKVGVNLGWAAGSLSIRIGGFATLTILIEDGFEMHLDIGFYLRWKIKWRFLWFSGSFGGGNDWSYRVFSPEEFSGNSTEGPWSFADNNTEPIDSRPRVATDHNGNAMMVWTQNKTIDGKMSTDICYSIWQDDDWGPANNVTNDNYPDSDPALTYYADGKVMLVWSRVTGDTSTMTVEEPFEILKTKEIAYSTWDGSSWSEPGLITDDNFADGRAVVSAGPSGETIAAWVGDPDYNFTTTTDMEIFYSIWNGISWTPKTALTNNDNMDYDIALAHDSGGNAILSWIRDIDGNRSTTDDIEIRYTKWEQDSWSDSGLVYVSDEDKESPSIVFDHNDNALITWVGRTDNMSRLYFATLDEVSGVWSEPEVVHEEPFFIYTPAINVDPDNNAVIVWRGFENDEQERDYYLTHNTTETYFDGEICYAIKDLSRPDAAWSEVKYLTSDNKTDWMASAVIIRGHSNDLLLVWEKKGELRNILRELKPDLTVTSSDITFSNQHPSEGETIDITATIYNIGDLKVENLEVSFYNGDPNIGGTLIGTSIIPFLDYDSNDTVSIPWVAEAGVQQIYVVIDPTDLISEFDETNNQAFKEIRIIPDISIVAEDINFSDPLPKEGDTIAIEAAIYNNGGTIAENVLVYFYSDNDLIYNVIIPSILENDFVSISAPWVVLAGNNNISIIIDPLEQILEWNEYNNKAWKILSIHPDLEISQENIILSSTSLNLGETLTIDAKIRNIGDAHADNVLIELFDGNPYEDGILIESRIVEISIGGTNVVSFNWIPPIGGHQIFIIIDREDVIFELDELNNIAYQELSVTAYPDLTISEYYFVSCPDFKEISINVENMGIIGASGIVIDVYDGDPALGGEILVSRLILHIGAGESEFLEIELIDLPEGDFIYLVVDPDNIIQESDEENNLLIIDYSMIPLTDAGPDQSVVEGDIVQFIGSLSIGDPLDYNFYWEFGDGETADTIDPTHTYRDNGEYVVRLQVTGAHYIGYDYLLISVSNAIPSVVAGTDFEINEGDEIAFEGSFSDPGSLDSHTILWDFGDGDTASDTLNPSHIYEDNGIYIVTLIVTDDDGGVGTDSLTVTVYNIAPTVDIGEDLSADEDEVINFSGIISDPGILDTHTFIWDFGDGNSDSDTLTPTHSYEECGVYTVSLTATDKDGDKGVDYLDVTVLNINPIANAGEDQTIIEDELVTFNGNQSWDTPSDLPLLEYSWDFGDGFSDTGLIVSHTYNKAGTYTATLEVMDDDGSSDTDSCIITVLDITPPITELLIDEYYLDAEGMIHVTTRSNFSLTATDVYSEVSETFYRINESEWTTYDTSFNLMGISGQYFIEYYSTDIYGNDETPKITIVILDEDFLGYGYLRIGEDKYKGEAKLFLSRTFISIEIDEQLFTWSVTDYSTRGRIERYYGEGLYGDIKVTVIHTKSKIIVIAIGKGVLFIGSKDVSTNSMEISTEQSSKKVTNQSEALIPRNLFASLLLGLLILFVNNKIRYFKTK